MKKDIRRRTYRDWNDAQEIREITNMEIGESEIMAESLLCKVPQLGTSRVNGKTALQQIEDELEGEE